MSAEQEKVSLYLQGTFSTPHPDKQQVEAMVAAANDIAESGFGTVILGQWHVHSDGTLYYNDAPLNTVMQQLKVIPTILTLGKVKKVLLTFGPFPSDFRAIRNNLELFKSTVLSIREQTGINGLDWDLEGDYDQFSDLLVELTQWGTSQGMTVTAAPYTDSTFWQKILKQTNAGGATGFSWWNLQLYGGADYASWVGSLEGIVPNPQSFLVPGFNSGAGSTPSTVQNSLVQLESRYSGLDGGFVWKYESMARYTAADFASAITVGLSDSWVGSRQGSVG